MNGSTIRAIAFRDGKVADTVYCRACRCLSDQRTARRANITWSVVRIWLRAVIDKDPESESLADLRHRFRFRVSAGSRGMHACDYEVRNSNDIQDYADVAVTIL